MICFLWWYTSLGDTSWSFRIHTHPYRMFTLALYSRLDFCTMWQFHPSKQLQKKMVRKARKKEKKKERWPSSYFEKLEDDQSLLTVWQWGTTRVLWKLKMRYPIGPHMKQNTQEVPNHAILNGPRIRNLPLILFPSSLPFFSSKVYRRLAAENPSWLSCSSLNVQQ